MFDKIAQNIQTEDCATLFRIAKNNDNFTYKFDEYSSENKISENIESYEKGKTNEAIHVKIPKCSKSILAGVFDVFDPACHHSRDK